MKTLIELRDYLNDRASGEDRNLDRCNLPVFSSREPADTHGLYSWDDTHALIYCDGVWIIRERQDGGINYE
jgi:hypothetical protein